MAIYGTALLSFCLLTGLIVGKLLGSWCGLDIDVGGVGIAMLLLIFITDRLRKNHHWEISATGIRYWSAIYIPIVVAMAASLDVRAAIMRGPSVIVAGLLVVITTFALVPVIARGGIPAEPEEP